ncbi:universal stress protein [Reichenbachiella sp. MALMAid0571]|uniref:universal stress protein n=1 Tax=Reichenbachiella sp. MALMAid0571 TaxID=3143939 RepID=UPI0032DFB4AB
MSNFKKILVPFDDNARSIGALEYAAMFATGIGAKITALHLADPKDYHSKEEFQKELAEMVDQQLRPTLHEIQKTYSDIRKIDLQIRGLEKAIPQHIVEFSEENEIDFIVMKSHGLPDTDDWDMHLKSTNAYKVVLESTCPVFTFTEIPIKPKMKNILVPLDLSEGSLYKIPFAASLAQQFEATLHLVSASEHKEDQEELQHRLDQVSNELTEKGIKIVKNGLFPGTLPAAIQAYTEKSGIDLVIIMSRPSFKWSDLWVSPKAKRIISHSKVPVVSIRSNKPLEVDL